MNRAINMKLAERKIYMGDAAAIDMAEERHQRLTKTQYKGILGAMLILMLLPNCIFATNGATAGLSNLESFISEVVKIAGSILAVISFTILGPGLSQHDLAQIKMGLMSLAGAATMVFHMQILGLMGVV